MDPDMLPMAMFSDFFEYRLFYDSMGQYIVDSIWVADNKLARKLIDLSNSSARVGCRSAPRQLSGSGKTYDNDLIYQ